MRPIGPTTLIESAINFVSYRLRSRKEIAAYLEKTAKRKGFSRIDIDRAMIRMEELGYVNDRRFAEAFVSSRLGTKPKGRMGIRSELEEKGIDVETAEEVLDLAFSGQNVQPVDELDLAHRALGRREEIWKKLPAMERRKKVYGFLLRRGFGSDIASRIVDSIRETD